MFSQVFFATRRRLAAFAAAAITIGAAACGEPVQSPTAESRAPSLPAVSPADSSVATLSRALATALGDATLRHLVLEDLRDSPFPLHRIHLASYLRGNRGAQWLNAAARVQNVSTAELLRVATEVSGGLELWMPRAADRMNWAGTDDISVFGTSLSPQQRLAKSDDAVGYDVTGAPVKVDLGGPSSEPYFALMPMSVTFGPTPEQARAESIRHVRTTISTPDEERAVLWNRGRKSGANRNEECPDLPTPEPCEPPDSPGPPVDDGSGLVLPSGRTIDQCYPATAPAWADDQDADGVVDSCEYELAYAFRPRLRMAGGEFVPSMEPYWSVRGYRNGTGYLEIFYALAYYRDGGFQCCGGAHPGDSEFIVVRVGNYPYTQRWSGAFVTLSAHYNGLQDKTSSYWAGDMEYKPGEYRQRPEVYVSWGKHANYRTHGACSSGGAGFDNCDGHWEDPAGLDIRSDANLGNATPPGSVPIKDCVPSRAGQPGTECFWAATGYFHGWLLEPTDTTRYRIMLLAFGF